MVVTAVMGTLLSNSSKVRSSLPVKEQQRHHGRKRHTADLQLCAGF